MATAEASSASGLSGIVAHQLAAQGERLFQVASAVVVDRLAIERLCQACVFAASWFLASLAFFASSSACRNSGPASVQFRRWPPRRPASAPRRAKAPCRCPAWRSSRAAAAALPGDAPIRPCRSRPAPSRCPASASCAPGRAAPLRRHAGGPAQSPERCLDTATWAASFLCSASHCSPSSMIVLGGSLLAISCRRNSSAWPNSAASSISASRRLGIDDQHLVIDVHRRLCRRPARPASCRATRGPACRSAGRDTPERRRQSPCPACFSSLRRSAVFRIGIRLRQQVVA